MAKKIKMPKAWGKKHGKLKSRQAKKRRKK
jgi:hypothetical protein